MARRRKQFFALTATLASMEALERLRMFVLQDHSRLALSIVSLVMDLESQCTRSYESHLVLLIGTEFFMLELES